MTQETDAPRVREVKRSEDRFLGSDLFETDKRQLPPRNGTGSVVEAARDIPVYHRCGVLVVGGGPAGTAAAWAAAKAGGDVVLMERYNHLWRAFDRRPRHLDRPDDRLDRPASHSRALPRIFSTAFQPRAWPGPAREDWGSRDPKKASYWGQRSAAFPWRRLLVADARSGAAEAHQPGKCCWKRACGSSSIAGRRLPIVRGWRGQGRRIFGPREGRKAILADVWSTRLATATCSRGPGARSISDIEEADVHHSANTAFMLGGADMDRWLAFRANEPEQYAQFAALGPRNARLLPAALCELAQRLSACSSGRASRGSRRSTSTTRPSWRSARIASCRTHCDFFRAHAPGFENCYMLQSAPQLGVRHTRRLVGTGRIERGQWSEGIALPDEDGVSPSVSLKFPVISVPYGSLVPRSLDGLLAGGKHVSCDANSHGFMARNPAMLADGTGGRCGGGRSHRGPACSLARSTCRRSRRELRRQGVFPARSCRAEGRGTGCASGCRIGATPSGRLRRVWVRALPGRPPLARICQIQR